MLARLDPQRTLAGGAEIVVADQGPGVPPEERARLGERFHTVPGGGEPGSGPGLSIVRRIAERHRAELAFGEPASGRGLEVRVRFAHR